MFAIPGFDPKTMSDEQLLERSNDLSRKINFAATYTGNGGLEMMLRMSEMIDFERRERAFLANWNRIESYVAQPIETDPDLRDAALAKDRAGKPVTDKPTRARPRVTGMRRPVPTPSPQVNRPIPTPGPLDADPQSPTESPSNE